MAAADRMLELHKELLSLRISDWHDKVFSFQWFFIVFLIIAPWVIWWRLANKKYITEIFCFGLLIMVTAITLNDIGLQLLLWKDPFTLFPVPNRWYAPAYSFLPVLFMLTYQYFTTWKSFTVATVVVAAVSAFVLQPILTWMGIFILIKWNYLYSFLIFVFSGLGIRLLLQTILQAKRTDTGEKAHILAGSPSQSVFASPALKRLVDKLK